MLTICNMTMLNEIKKKVHLLYNSVLFDFPCNITMTFDKSRLIEDIEPVSTNDLIDTPNGPTLVKEYDIMLMLGKLKDSKNAVRMKFDKTSWVSITNVALISSVKLIKQGFNRDMHTKTLTNVATDKKICNIEEHFEIITLKYNSIAAGAAINDKITTSGSNEMGISSKKSSKVSISAKTNVLSTSEGGDNLKSPKSDHTKSYEKILFTSGNDENNPQKTRKRLIKQKKKCLMKKETHGPT